MEMIINIQSTDTESIKALLIVHMFQLDMEEDESLNLSLLSTSSEESVIDYDDMTPRNFHIQVCHHPCHQIHQMMTRYL